MQPIRQFYSLDQLGKSFNIDTSTFPVRQNLNVRIFHIANSTLSPLTTELLIDFEEDETYTVEQTSTTEEQNYRSFNAVRTLLPQLPSTINYPIASSAGERQHATLVELD